MAKNLAFYLRVLWVLCALPLNLEARDAGYKIRQNAKHYVGISEKGGNNASFTDFIFQRKMTAVGWRPGNAWCSFFVKLILKEGNVPNSVSGWSPSSFNEDDPIYVGNKFVGKPNPNKVWVMSLAYNKFKKTRPHGIGHTGIVQDFGEHSFGTTEGNTTDAGTRDSRTGKDAVYNKRRPYSPNTLISQW